MRLRCTECDYVTALKSTLRVHTFRVHKKHYQGNVKFDCTKCDHKASSRGLLRRHDNAVHGIILTPRIITGLTLLGHEIPQTLQKLIY